MYTLPRMSKKSKTTKMSRKSLRGGARKSKGSRNSKKSTKGAKPSNITLKNPNQPLIGYCFGKLSLQAFKTISCFLSACEKTCFIFVIKYLPVKYSSNSFS